MMTQRDEDVLTVGQALDAWFESRLATFGPNTERDYRLAIRHQLKPFKFLPGQVPDTAFVRPPDSVSADAGLARPRHLGGPARDIDVGDHCVLANLPLRLVDDLLIGRLRQILLDQGLSVKRVANLMAPLRGAVERQVRLKRLDLNPFDLVQPLKKSLRGSGGTPAATPEGDLDAPLPGEADASFVSSEGEPDPLTTAEVAATLAQLEAPMINQVLFACWTGLRTGELIALRTSDLQLDRNRFLVRRSLSRGILKTTKTDKQRWVDLHPPARAALEAQLQRLGHRPGWVFPNPFTGERWANESKITRRWQKALAQAGVRYRRPYQMRHTYASWLLSAGENPLYVAAQMGHADWGMIIKVYGRWIPSASGHEPGKRVAAAHAADWAAISEWLKARSTEVP